MSPWWLLVALAVFLIGITKSGFGSGTITFALGCDMLLKGAWQLARVRSSWTLRNRFRYHRPVI